MKMSLKGNFYISYKYLGEFFFIILFIFFLFLLHISFLFTMSNERTSLLDRRRSIPQQPQQTRNYTEGTSPLSIPLPSPFREQEPLLFPASVSATPNSSNKRLHNRFKWFNKRTGSYDEDRQGLVKENTGIRVWSESYSSIGK